MSLCTGNILTTTIGRDKVAVTLRCRSWTCDECAELRKRALVALAQAGRPNKLLTLTSQVVEGVTREARAIELVRAWRLIRRNHFRAHPNNFINFLAIFEGTDEEWPHLHILLRCLFVDQRWLSAEMDRLTGSPIVDIRAVHTKRGAARYVSKYVGKAPGKFGTLKRYWHSKDWQLEEFEHARSSEQWSVQQMTLAKWCGAWRAFGWNVRMDGADKAIASPLW